MTDREPLREQTLAVYLHNGFTSGVKGNHKAIGVLKNLLIPHPDVKAMIVYEGYPLEKVEYLNYTTLKELRAPKPQDSTPGDTTPESYHTYVKRELTAGRLPEAYPTWARGIDTPTPSENQETSD